MEDVVKRRAKLEAMNANRPVNIQSTVSEEESIEAGGKLHLLIVALDYKGEPLLAPPHTQPRRLNPSLARSAPPLAPLHPPLSPAPSPPVPGTECELSCSIDGERLMSLAKRCGCSDIVSLVDNTSSTAATQYERRSEYPLSTP
jgi:hypothetical protein